MARESAGSFQDTRRLLRYVLRRRGLFFRASSVLMVSCILQLCFPKGAEMLVDGTLHYGDPRLRDINSICSGLLGIVALVLTARFFEMCWFQELGERAVSDLRGDTFDHLVRLPMSWYSDKRAGDLTSRLLADLAQVQELWIFDLRMIFTYSAVLVGAAVMLLVTSWELASVVFAVVPVVIILALIVGPRIRRQSAATQEKLAVGAIILDEAMLGMQNIKSCATEKFEGERFRRSMADYVVPALRGSRTRAFFVCGVVISLLCTWVYMMWHGSWMIRENRLTPGEFTAFMFYLGFGGTASGIVAENFAKLQRALGANSRIVEILDAVPEELDGLGAPERPRLRGQVEFRDVSFRYPARPEAAALHEVAFLAKAGESVALVGPSGAGKSTIAALLCQLYQPSTGEILYDDSSGASYPLGWLRSQMAYVPQEVLLFGGTIAENISYGRPQATREQICDAARRANALEFIERLPLGLGTLVGDRGAQLSGGQRQRIALARAILKDPAILVLDEATSALDAESEALIQAALQEIMQQRTTFIIAHRLSTVRRAQRILVLHEGRIVESGTHDELYAAGGAYRHLCARQLNDS